VLEEPFAGAEQYREGPQAVLVDCPTHERASPTVRGISSTPAAVAPVTSTFFDPTGRDGT
jgi:hypothetical protein